MTELDVLRGLQQTSDAWKASDAVYEWLLAEARWWALIWSLEAIDHGGGLDWWAGPFPWEAE